MTEKKEGSRPNMERALEIKAGTATLQAILGTPTPKGVIVFAHRSGKGRLNPRNQITARALQEGGLVTCRVDLLGEPEAKVLHNIFDIKLLADRLLEVTRWIARQPEFKGLPIGYYGFSTGAAAALQAAARSPDAVVAVVARGGRPDLARTFLSKVKAPTLLLVGGKDATGIEQNRKAYEQLTCPKELVIVPEATHLFEEAGTIEQVASQTRAWFLRYLVQDSA